MLEATSRSRDAARVQSHGLTQARVDIKCNNMDNVNLHLKFRSALLLLFPDVQFVNADFGTSHIDRAKRAEGKGSGEAVRKLVQQFRWLRDNTG